MNRWGIVGFAHWFVAVGFLTLPLTLVHAYRPAVPGRLDAPWIGDWLPFELLRRVHRRDDDLGIVVLIVIRLLNLPVARRAASPASRAPRPARRTSSSTSSSPSASPSSRCAASRARCTTSTTTRPRTSSRTRWSLAFKGLSAATLQNLVYLVAMIKIGDVVHLDDRGLAQHQHGRGLAPLPGVPQHLVQARGRRRDVALGALQPMTVRRQADRLRGPGRGRRLRRLPGRALLLEGPARLLHLHRVRPLPVAVPRLEHRQAALPEAADHVAARPRARQGAVPARRRRQGRRGQGEGHRRAARGRARRGPRRGRAPADRHRSRRTASSTRTCCGPAPPAAPASSSARSTSSTSTTSSTCAATR